MTHPPPSARWRTPSSVAAASTPEPSVSSCAVNEMFGRSNSPTITTGSRMASLSMISARIWAEAVAVSASTRGLPSARAAEASAR
jgi:hypothetical protein